VHAKLTENISTLQRMMWDVILGACIVLASLELLFPHKKAQVNKPKWLLTISLTQAELTGTTIKGIASGVLAWADRPNRMTRHLKVSALLEMFGPDGTFHADPPNAVISSAGRVYIVELTGCNGSKEGLTFSYRPIDHIPPDLQTLESDVSKHCVMTIGSEEQTQERSWGPWGRWGPWGKWVDRGGLWSRNRIRYRSSDRAEQH
jgi:hypothetical protein